MTEGVTGGDYQTGYDGVPSNAIPVISVVGSPISGRAPMVNYDFNPQTGKTRLKDADVKRGEIRPNEKVVEFLQGKEGHIRRIEEWKTTVAKKVERTLKKAPQGQAFPRIPSAAASGCILMLTFRLEDKEREHEDGVRVNPYAHTDLDNLLKPVLDALDKAGLVTDDSYFKGIKAVKEPATHSQPAGVDIRCIATKSFQIVAVDAEVPGGKFMRRWQNPMQFVTARENDNGQEWRFIDNAPDCIFVSNENRDFLDVIPGFRWEEAKRMGMVVDGCVVTKRAHKEGDDEKTFHWLQKWAW